MKPPRTETCSHASVPEPKVIDIRTRGPFYPPGSLGAVLKDIDDGFKRKVPTDG